MARGSTLLDTAEDVQWLKDTHLRGVRHPAFKSAVIYGNEDAPDKIELYAKRDPLHTDRPIFTVAGNAPLKGVAAIGSNMTQAEHGARALFAGRVAVPLRNPGVSGETAAEHLRNALTLVRYFPKPVTTEQRDALAAIAVRLDYALENLERWRGNPRGQYRRIRVGDRLQVSEGAGLDSGRIGVVQRVLSPGVRSPGGLGGHGRTGSVAILKDAKGQTFEMFTAYLSEPGAESFRAGNPRDVYTPLPRQRGSRIVRENPALAILGNPGPPKAVGTVKATWAKIEYIRPDDPDKERGADVVRVHEFPSGFRMTMLTDGSIHLWHPTRKLWVEMG